MNGRVSASRGRRGSLLLITHAWLGSEGVTTGRYCRGRLRSLSFMLAVTGWMVQVVPRRAVAGPKTASGHWCLPDDAGAGMVWTVRPVPTRVSDCGLQPVAKPSWRRSWGGPFRPAGEIRPRRAPSAHDKGI